MLIVVGQLSEVTTFSGRLWFHFQHDHRFSYCHFVESELWVHPVCTVSVLLEYEISHWPWSAEFLELYFFTFLTWCLCPVKTAVSLPGCVDLRPLHGRQARGLYLNISGMYIIDYLQRICAFVEVLCCCMCRYYFCSDIF